MKEAGLRTEELDTQDAWDERHSRPGASDALPCAHRLRRDGTGAFSKRPSKLMKAIPTQFVTARTHLLYGEWLRRQGERRAARGELAEALGYLRQLRCRALVGTRPGELRASGMTLRSRPHTGQLPHTGRTPSRAPRR